METAVKGYVRFALDATRLQKRFEKELRYASKTYAEAAAAVYHNEEYMSTLYLPGILLSNYLWPHHYSQLCYFHNRFAPLALDFPDKRFADVGVGTGFYSCQMLGVSEEIRGDAFDISDYSICHSKHMVDAFGFSGRWVCHKRNVIESPPEQTWPLLISVEVLEHLENPVVYLKRLRDMLQQGGKAFITAAVTAPNEDHIYLYNNASEVEAELVEAGFSILDFQEDIAYESKKGEPVPRLVAFIVT
jgi:2-polyprenyl-3-methyl-5-hydroxy-6-metoxy-1,4-benzoquinol methylase